MQQLQLCSTSGLPPPSLPAATKLPLITPSLYRRHLLGPFQCILYPCRCSALFRMASVHELRQVPQNCKDNMSQDPSQRYTCRCN